MSNLLASCFDHLMLLLFAKSVSHNGANLKTLQYAMIMKVDRHPQFQTSRCLFVVRLDGVWIDFSYQKCLRAYIRSKYPHYAEKFLRKYFKRGSGTNSCWTQPLQLLIWNIYWSCLTIWTLRWTANGVLNSVVCLWAELKFSCLHSLRDNFFQWGRWKLAGNYCTKGENDWPSKCGI